MGARKVMETINPLKDLIVVVDVTSIANRPELEFSFEKVRNPRVRDFIRETLKDKGFQYEIF
jgi:hypothetical protein